MDSDFNYQDGEHKVRPIVNQGPAQGGHAQRAEALNKEFDMVWGVLFLAGLFEIGWAVGLKYTEGFTRPWPTVGTVLAMVTSVVLLGWALKHLPVGTAYAIWTGIGAVGTAIAGIVLLGESASPARLACIGLIAVGIVGLKMVSSQ